MKKKLLKVGLIILSLLPFIFVFISTLYQPIDPDLGWHLKYGEYFFEKGSLLKENIFSTEMPDFRWPNVSWGTDLITYFTFKNFGFLGLTLLSALIVTLTFFFFSKLAKLSLWEQTLIFPLLTYFEKPVNSVSFRGQLISILFLGILFYLIDKAAEKNPKLAYFIILLFFIWVNLHGQFLIGLLIFALWIGLKIIVNFFAETSSKLTVKNIIASFEKEKTFLLVLFLSLLATFLNPFGFGLYQDALSHFNNRDLGFIAEYVPFDELSTGWWNQLILGILILFGFIFLHFTDQLKKNIPLLGVSLSLFVMSFFVRRYAWSLYYLTIPFIKPIAEFFKPETVKYQRLASAVILTGLLILITYLKMPLTQFADMNWDIYCIENTCSKESAEFLSNYKYDGKLLTYYNWGGFLIWNYPKVKVSIDGRMHLWKDEKGYSAFSQYYPLEQNLTDIDKSKYNIVYIGPEKPLYDRLVELVKEKKWKVVYHDEQSGIFERMTKGK